MPTKAMKEMPDVKVAGLIRSWLAREARAEAWHLASECGISGWWILITLVIAVAMLCLACGCLAVRRWKAKKKKHTLGLAKNLDQVWLTRFEYFHAGKVHSW